MNKPDLDVRERDEGRPPLKPLVHAHDVRRDGVVMTDDRVTVTCATVEHPLVPAALAYRFDCPDRSIVFSGDTHKSSALVRLARGADILVHEALYLAAAPGAPGSALRKHIVDSHTTAEDAGRVAEEAGVKTLVLSHFVPSENPPISDEQWAAAARRRSREELWLEETLMEL